VLAPLPILRKRRDLPAILPRFTIASGKNSSEGAIRSMDRVKADGRVQFAHEWNDRDASPFHLPSSRSMRGKSLIWPAINQYAI
jgi:hypothetical protein